VSNPYKSQVSENENVNDKLKLIDRTHVREKEIKTGNVQENAKTNNQDKLINENKKNKSNSKSQPNITSKVKKF